MTPLDRRIAAWEQTECDCLFLLKRQDLTPEERHRTNLKRKKAARKVAELRHERRFSPRAKASS